MKEARMATLNNQSITIPVFNEESALLAVLQAKKENVPAEHKASGLAGMAGGKQPNIKDLKIEIDRVADKQNLDPC